MKVLLMDDHIWFYSTKGTIHSEISVRFLATTFIYYPNSYWSTVICNVRRILKLLSVLYLKIQAVRHENRCVIHLSQMFYALSLKRHASDKCRRQCTRLHAPRSVPCESVTNAPLRTWRIVIFTFISIKNTFSHNPTF